MNKILLIGQTNMGKSSLFNALIGRSISIVDMKDNLTKDVIKFESENFTLFDSPGISDKEELKDILKKTGPVDIYCLVFNNSLTKLEKDLIKILNKERVVLVFNSSTLPLIQLSGMEVVKICIKNRENIDKLRKILSINNTSSIRKKTWSIFGRANVGKSTLANRLVGFDRFVVADEIGTTLEVHSEFSNKILSNIEDTPGYRKNNTLSILEQASQYRLERKIKNTEFNLALVVLDSKQGLTKSDKYIIDEVLNSSLVIVVLNKIDLISKEELFNIKKEVARIYPNVQIIPVSGAKGRGVDELIKQMNSSEEVLVREIKTSALNKMLHQEICYPPIKYITRTGFSEFLLFSKKDIPVQKIRFIERSIVNKFNLFGIRLSFTIRGF